MARLPSIRRAGPLSATFAASSGIQALNLLTGVLIARALGASGRGELTAVLLWPGMLASIGSLGVTEAVTFHAARRSTSVRGLLGTALAIGAVQAGLLVLLGLVLLPVVLDGYPAEALDAAYLFLVYVPLNLGQLYVMAVLNGLERFAHFNALRATVIVLTAVGLVGIAVADAFTVFNATIVYLAANAATLLAGAVLIARASEGRPSFERRMVRPLLGYGIRSHLSNVSNMLNERLDQLVMSIFLTPVQLGLYVIAYTMTSLTSLVGSSVSFVALPAVASQEEPKARGAVARRYVAITIIVATVLTIPVLVLAPMIIDVVFGDEFNDAAGAARVLLVATIAFAAGRVLGGVLKGANRPLDAGTGELVGLAVTAAALALLLPSLEIVGAAIASLLAYTASMAFLAWKASRALGLGMLELLVPAREHVAELVRPVRLALLRERTS